MPGTLKMTPSDQKYVFTDHNGVARGTFKLHSIRFWIEGDTCGVRGSWTCEEVFQKDGTIVDRSGATAWHNTDTGFELPLKTRGAVACLEATLAADIEEDSINRAILREFAEAVEGCWDIRTFLAARCTEL